MDSDTNTSINKSATKISLSSEFKKLENFAIQHHELRLENEYDLPLRLYIQLFTEESKSFFRKIAKQQNINVHTESYVEYKKISLPEYLDKFLKIPIKKLLWQGEFSKENFPRNVTYLIIRALECSISRSQIQYRKNHGLPLYTNQYNSDSLDWNFYCEITGQISHLFDLTDIPMTYASHKIFGKHNHPEIQERIEKDIDKRLWKLIKNKRIYELFGLTLFQLCLEQKPFLSNVDP